MDRDRIIDKLRDTAVTVEGTEYTLLRALGRGGNGVAFLCRSRTGDELVAKIYIPPDKRDLDAQSLERFKAEIAITSKVRHVYVVPALGAATVRIGAYVLPLYLMPFAPDTMRTFITAEQDGDSIERKLRIFLRASLGVACLHHYGIVHRDLKPENILINRSGDPWIADLGIAHVNPGFVSEGLKTIASERLLNRDYSAPEQRHGEKADVDHRADIYALGCIFYEMLTSIPPIRANVPALATLTPSLAPFDAVWKRMTEWNMEHRYQSMEQVLEDVAFAMGTVLATLRGTAGYRNPDLATMSKSIRSNNEVHRRKAIEIAARLGKAALPELHSLMGHTRRDIRNSAATALGQILDSSSVPFLVAGLYGNGEKAGSFRPTAEAAAQALSYFPSDERLRALRAIERPILLEHAETLAKGLDRIVAYDEVLRLSERGLLALDWFDTPLKLLIALDEERAWPDVQEYIAAHDGFSLSTLIMALSRDKKRQAVRMWLDKELDSKYVASEQLDFLAKLKLPKGEHRELLDQMEQRLRDLSLKREDRRSLLKRIHSARLALR